MLYLGYLELKPNNLFLTIIYLKQEDRNSILDQYKSSDVTASDVTVTTCDVTVTTGDVTVTTGDVTVTTGDVTRVNSTVNKTKAHLDITTVGKIVKCLKLLDL